MRRQRPNYGGAIITPNHPEQEERQYERNFSREERKMTEKFNNALLDLRESPETLSQEYYVYLHSKDNHPWKIDKDDPLKDIDTIDVSLVGKCLIDELYNNTKSVAECHGIFRTLRWIISSGRLQDISLLNEIQQQLRAAQKGIPDGVRPPTALVSAAVRKLYITCGLFQYHPDINIWAEAGAFFVEKSNGKLRVIVDGRYSNTFFDKAAGKFELFTIETVRQVIDNLSINKRKKQRPWYAINFDLRHWFHQLPLPKRLQGFFKIDMMDRGDEQGDFFMFPQMVPMGWTLAPRIAQCATWSRIMASNKDNKFSQKGHLPEAVRESMKNSEDPPAWVPLESGGGIFVLLDNILVVTPHEHVANWWFDRIVANCEKFHAVSRPKELRR